MINQDIYYYRYLKQALLIHKMLIFKQSTWLKPLTLIFFYKLSNIAVFGKTMENIRRHRVVLGSMGILFEMNLKKKEIIFNKPECEDVNFISLKIMYMRFSLQTSCRTKLSIEKCKLMYMDADNVIYELQYDIVKL